MVRGADVAVSAAHALMTATRLRFPARHFLSSNRQTLGLPSSTLRFHLSLFPSPPRGVPMVSYYGELVGLAWGSILGCRGCSWAVAT